MSLANYCLGLLKRKSADEEGSINIRPNRYDGRIMIDVTGLSRVNQPEWFTEYERMIRRVYGTRHSDTLAPEWHNASAFKEWWEAQNKEPDDVISWTINVIDGSHFTYCPETGLFVKPEVLRFFAPYRPKGGVDAITSTTVMGVRRKLSQDRSYYCVVKNHEGKDRMCYFYNALDAHLHWLSYQHDVLSNLLTHEHRQRQRSALESRLSRIQDAISDKKILPFL